MIRRGLTALTGSALLAGCGGGGSAPSAPLPLATTGAITGGASQSRTPVATASLTLKFPAGFHTAKSSAIARTSASASRKPAYVNSNPKYLDVWVLANGTATHVVDSSGGSNVIATPDGSQTFSIPLYSYNTNQIVAYESDQQDGAFGNLLSLGEADLGSFSPGSAPQIALTMLMFAQYIGIMSDPNNGNFDATVNPSFNAPGCSVSTAGPYYFFTADADMGFVDAAGAGGVSSPLVSGWTADPGGTGNSISQASGVNGGYNVVFNSTSGGVTIRLTAPNLAFAIASNVFNNGGSLYPGVYALYNASNYDASFNSQLYTQLYLAGPTVSAAIDVVLGGC